MANRLYVNADWNKLVPEDSPDAAFFIREDEAARRGLTKAGKPAEDKAISADSAEDKTVTSAKVRSQKQRR